MIRPKHQSIDVTEANGDGQQLFIADLFRQKRVPAPSTRTAPAAWPDHYPVTHRQLVLFDVEHDLRAGRRRGFGAPPLPDLVAALDHAVDDHAAAYGWRRGLVDMTRHGIHILLSIQDTPGAPITFSEAVLLNQLPSHTVQPVVEVLSGVGMFDDDREPPLESWFARQSADLPEPMLTELRQWFLALRDGSTTAPRSSPRKIESVRGSVASVIPALHAWAAAGHHSLREVSREDVTAMLPSDAERRRQMISGLRSLFRFLKSRRVVFLNPTARLRLGPVTATTPLPIEISAVRDALHSVDPLRAALAALVAFHALRMGQLRGLLLTDLRDGRLCLDSRTIPLAGPVRDRVSRWLDERTRRWPNTINPHLFVSQQTAVRTTPVSDVWIGEVLGLSTKAIRDDRILHEAIATGGDVRRLCDLFGVSVGTALRYTHSPEPFGSAEHTALCVNLE